MTVLKVQQFLDEQASSTLHKSVLALCFIVVGIDGFDSSVVSRTNAIGRSGAVVNSTAGVSVISARLGNQIDFLLIAVPTLLVAFSFWQFYGCSSAEPQGRALPQPHM